MSEENQESSTLARVLRCGLYSAVASIAVPAVSGMIQDNRAYCQRMNVDLPTLTIAVFRNIDHAWAIGALVFMLTFSVLILIGSASQSRSTRAFWVAVVLALSFGLAGGMWWASELPKRSIKAALQAQPPAPTNPTDSKPR